MDQKKDQFAPVVLIAYNRLDHFKLTLASLIRNPEAKTTEINLFIDGPKNNDDLKIQELIINHAQGSKNNFATLNVVRRETNLGLRKNITQAINSVLENSHEVIVLEDDIIVSTSFLSYMNEALKVYKDNSKVWHINGFSELNYQERLENIYMSRFMSCWGWATWKNRWAYYERDIKKIFRESDFLDRAYLSLFGISNRWRQIKANKTGKIDTWAVFWHATIAKKRGMCVSPWVSYTKNIGFDGSGTNCHEEKNIENTKLNHCRKPNLTSQTKENKLAVFLMTGVFIRVLFKAIKRKLSREQKI